MSAPPFPLLFLGVWRGADWHVPFHSFLVSFSEALVHDVHDGPFIPPFTTAYLHADPNIWRVVPCLGLSRQPGPRWT